MKIKRTDHTSSIADKFDALWNKATPIEGLDFSRQLGGKIFDRWLTKHAEHGMRSVYVNAGREFSKIHLLLSYHITFDPCWTGLRIHKIVP
jgi:hypothetical protein